MLDLIVVLVLLTGVVDSPDIEVFGVGVPAWIGLLVTYLLGVVAGVAAARTRSARS